MQQGLGTPAAFLSGSKLQKSIRITQMHRWTKRLQMERTCSTNRECLLRACAHGHWSLTVARLLSSYFIERPSCIVECWLKDSELSGSCSGGGSAVLAAGFPQLGIGFAGTALAFGLTVLAMAYAVGHISGGHFNPAVTIGQWAGGLFPFKFVVPYVIVQVAGALAHWRRGACTSSQTGGRALTPLRQDLPPTASEIIPRAAIRFSPVPSSN